MVIPAYFKHVSVAVGKMTVDWPHLLSHSTIAEMSRGSLPLTKSYSSFIDLTHLSLGAIAFVLEDNSFPQVKGVRGHFRCQQNELKGTTELFRLPLKSIKKIKGAAPSVALLKISP